MTACASSIDYRESNPKEMIAQVYISENDGGFSKYIYHNATILKLEDYPFKVKPPDAIKLLTHVGKPPLPNGPIWIKAKQSGHKQEFEADVWRVTRSASELSGLN
jgi:hypothetical protein